jgi:hypothetical protein
MKKSVAALFLFALCLGAADFWSKPSSEWSDKDLLKMITNSPWAHGFSLGFPGGGGADSGAPSPMSERGGGGRGGGGAGGAPGGAAPAPAGPAPTIYARFQSALPVREAFVRLKYHAEAATSPEAKQVLERSEPDYVIVVSGPLRAMLKGDSEQLKQPIMENSFLSTKGKAFKPTDIQIALAQSSNDMVFHFPRTNPFTLDDKEVEFSAKLGDVTVKYKFKLKDMVYNGKLEM